MNNRVDGENRRHDYACRRRIHDCLRQPSGLRDLADATGITDARLVWHLDRMQESGEVRRSDDGLWSLSTAESLPSTRNSVQDEHQAVPERISDDFNDAFLEVAQGLYGSHIHQATGEHRTRLSQAQANEFTQRLQALVAEYFAPGSGDRTGIKYGLYWVMTPIDLHPLDDEPFQSRETGPEEVRVDHDS